MTTESEKERLQEAFKVLMANEKRLHDELDEAVWNLSVSQETVRTLLADGRGNAVVIQNPDNQELFACGIVHNPDEQFFLIPITDEFPTLKDLKVGARVDLEAKDVATHAAPKGVQ